jgi:hypothetical protein
MTKATWTGPNLQTESIAAANRCFLQGDKCKRETITHNQLVRLAIYLQRFILKVFIQATAVAAE